MSDPLDRAMGATGRKAQNNSATTQDDRLDARGATPHDRLDKSRDDGDRADRSVAEDRVLNEDERLEMFRESFFQSSLPDLPPIKGFHLCWLTTTNPRDTIQHRLRLGYMLIRADEIPGWEYVSPKAGEYAGMVMVNEMIAAKLPETLYQRFMAEVHHHQPNSEEEKIRGHVEEMQEQAKSVKGKLIVEEGMAEMGRDRPIPMFG